MKKAKLKKITEKLSGYYGEPFDNKAKPGKILDVLIATKLSQNTTDKSSYKAYRKLKEDFLTWDDVCNAELSSIRNCIKVCGLANTKSKNIKEMLLKMRGNYGNLDLSFIKKFSNDEIYKELLQYEGIGVKTISCVLIFALGRDAFPVDTHVHRILNRLGIVKTNSAEKTFEAVKDVIPEGKKYRLHSELIKFGRNICKSNKPLCNVCFLYSECEFELKKIYRKNKIPAAIKENNFIILENI
ncbi:MAG TPA: endonuclease III [Ignavibacteria bacterium]|nr:endonuclease III [Ignavibacteria bacterium]